MMFGQMTAGSWIYIGSQGIVQGTYETFVEMGRQHFGGNLRGKWILTAGLGGMGGAQPLAATMAGASMLAIECRPERIAKRLQTKYLDVEAATSMRRSRSSSAPRRSGKAAARSACSATPARCCRSCCAAASSPTRVTDQTSAHDPVNGYLPGGWSWRSGIGCAARTRSRSRRRRAPRWRGTSRRCSPSSGRVSRYSTTATTCARSPSMRASRTRLPFPGSCPRTCGRCSAAAWDRFAGWRSRGTRRTSTAPMRKCGTAARG